jgi:hypothetical protein
MNILIPGAIASIATLGVGAAVGGISAYREKFLGIC